MVYVNDYNCVLILYLGNNSGTEDRISEQWNGYMDDVLMLHGCCMDDTWMIECEITFPCI